VTIATTLSLHYLLRSEWVVVDLAWVAVFAAIHAVANWTSPGLPNASADCERAFGLVSGLATSSLTVVGILLPLSLTAVATFATKHAQARVLASIFVGDTWLVLSLAMGLLVLWTAGFRGHTENVQNIRGVRVLNGWQLLTLLAGVVRLLIATFFLVHTAR
jgi:hypothetical protein